MTIARSEASLMHPARRLADAHQHGTTGGTDNHLILADLTTKNVSGKIATKALDAASIELNYNSVPFDPRKPFDPSGIRLGTSSVTSRGMAEPEIRRAS